jgi:hypothetical protein
MDNPTDESVRLALQMAWNDYRHARDQTWKTVEIVAVLGAGLVTVDAQFKNVFATLLAGLLVIVASAFGVLISIAQRKAERRKWIHITNFEMFLGLDQTDLIPVANKYLKDAALTPDIQDAQISIPPRFKFWDAFNPKVQNTAMFILRMHLAIILFVLVVVGFRLFTWYLS